MLRHKCTDIMHFTHISLYIIRLNKLTPGVWNVPGKGKPLRRVSPAAGCWQTLFDVEPPSPVFAKEMSHSEKKQTHPLQSRWGLSNGVKHETREGSPQWWTAN